MCRHSASYELELALGVSDCEVRGSVVTGSLVGGVTLVPGVVVMGSLLGGGTVVAIGVLARVRSPAIWAAVREGVEVKCDNP